MLVDHVPRLVRTLTEDSPWVAGDPARGRKMLEDRVHSLMLVPLVVRGCALGLVCFYRWGSARGPFEDDDLELAVDLVGRAAVALDNGRRYIRERNTVLALQQGMLPQRFAAPAPWTGPTTWSIPEPAATGPTSFPFPEPAWHS